MIIDGDFIPGFNPETYCLTIGMTSQEAVRCNRLLAQGIIGQPHSLFEDVERMEASLQEMALYDPLLSIVCELSYKYKLHPVWEVGVAVKTTKPYQLENTVTDAVFRSRKMLLIENDWDRLAPYVNAVYPQQAVFLLDAHSDVYTELWKRWQAVRNRLLHANVINNSTTLFSYYSMGIVADFEAFLHKLSVREDAELSGDDFVMLTLRSFGISYTLETMIIKLPPPDPFQNL